MSEDSKDTKGTQVDAKAAPAAKQASLPASAGVKCRVIHGSYRTIVNGADTTLSVGDECTLSAADAKFGVEAGALEEV